MTPLQKILDAYTKQFQSERKKGTYFENLMCNCLRYKTAFAELPSFYSDQRQYMQQVVSVFAQGIAKADYSRGAMCHD